MYYVFTYVQMKKDLDLFPGSRQAIILLPTGLETLLDSGEPDCHLRHPLKLARRKETPLQACIDLAHAPLFSSGAELSLDCARSLEPQNL